MSTAQSLQEVFTNSTEKNTTRAQDWTEVYEAVRWIQLVMAVLSILGSGSIIVCVMLQRLSRTPELQPLFLLSVSDLLLALCWLVGAALFSRHCSHLNTHCYHLHTVEQVTQPDYLLPLSHRAPSLPKKHWLTCSFITMNRHPAAPNTEALFPHDV
ncbi:transmembrane protein 116-like [Micropterus dolomieu]|uniref:transmembrane protein 116-like n=1 Tax=Micropterus dolomieu TaxID=147949 RepID=UPI001E8D786F|nr:transmembrane protein 116-like [Micropterus dolomieu]